MEIIFVEGSPPSPNSTFKGVGISSCKTPPVPPCCRVSAPPPAGGGAVGGWRVGCSRQIEQKASPKKDGCGGRGGEFS